jgi:hypothetical protein
MSRTLRSPPWCTDQALAAREHVRLARDVERRPVPRAQLAERATAAACMLAWLLGGER